MTAKNQEIDLRSIIPRGGDQRGAFEELSYLLFAREHAAQGTPVRRDGAGGDAGLEGVVIDAEGRAMLGLQAKFFVEKLGPTQWRDLDRSMKVALTDNAADGALREIVVAIPRNLNQTQNSRWLELCAQWQEFSITLGYNHPIQFALWGESRLLDFLLKSEHRGLLLYFFALRDLDPIRCRELTRAAIVALGDRYLSSLHTATGVEERLHSFLRSDGSRREFSRLPVISSTSAGGGPMLGVTTGRLICVRH